LQDVLRETESFEEKFPDNTPLHTYGVPAAVLCRRLLPIFLSAEGCGGLAEGRVAEYLRFDCGQYGSITVFAVYLQFPMALCGCRTAMYYGLNRKSVKELAYIYTL